MKIVLAPMIGTVVRHTGWGFKKDKNYPCDVLIISGEYMGQYGISNFWVWRRILNDGELAPVEQGYGSFIESDKKYEVITTVKCIG